MDESQAAEFSARVGWSSQLRDTWEGFGISRVHIFTCDLGVLC